jgi:ADP-dependent phosphofructokinase/glucokinase
MDETACKSSSVLASQLHAWFNTWLNRPPGAEEWKLVYDLIHEGPSNLVDQLTPTELLEWVRRWNKRLILSLNQELPWERILCAFICVEDTIYLLDQTELDAFIQSAARMWKGMKPEHFVGSVVQQPMQKFVDEAIERAQSGKNGRGGKVNEECYDLVDVLAALLYAWQPGRSGLRPVLMDADLRAQMDQYVSGRQSARPGRVIELLGGASGNMANVLRELGLSVAVHWPYHAPDVAKLTPDCLQRMTLDNGKKKYTSAKTPFPDHPMRRSTILAYASGITLNPKPTVTLSDLEAKPIELSLGPEKIDRQIYRYPFNAGAGRRSWANMHLEDSSGQPIPINDPGNQVLREDGWPFIPLFGEWRVEGTDFVFKIADDALMQDIADQFDYLMLTGLQGLGDPLLNVQDQGGQYVNATARDLIRREMQRQLSALARKGVRLHLEVSGITTFRVADWIREAIHGSVKSVGINQEELEQITGDQAFRSSDYFLTSRASVSDPPEPFTKRYERALKLAKAFDLDELYVHGNDADLIVVRHVPRAAIWQGLVADLFAKGVVVLALLQRSVRNWHQLAANLAMTLKKDGFVSLLALADLISRDSSKTKPGEQATILRDISFNGYWFSRTPNDYSVAVVPVMWPELPHDLSAAGAGDAVSATFAVFGRI